MPARRIKAFDELREEVLRLWPEYRRKHGKEAVQKLWEYLLENPQAMSLGIKENQEKTFRRRLEVWHAEKGIIGSTALCQEGAFVFSGIRCSDKESQRDFSEGFDVDSLGVLGAVQRFTTVEFYRVKTSDSKWLRPKISQPKRAYFAIGSIRSNHITELLLDRILSRDDDNSRVEPPVAFCWGDSTPSENSLAVNLSEVKDETIRNKIAAGRAYGFRHDDIWHLIRLDVLSTQEAITDDYGVVLARQSNEFLDVAAIGGSGPGTLASCLALANAVEFEK